MHTYQDDGAVRTPPARSSTDEKQNRLMRIALGLLFVALAVVAVKDWSFWSDFLFPEDQVAESSSQTTTTASTVPAQTATSTAPVEHHTRAKHRATESAPPKEAEPVVTPVIMTSSRTVLPPLQIDVVGGNRHQTVQASKRSVQVDMQNATAPTGPTTSSQGDGVTTNAADRAAVSSSATNVVTHSVTPNYPTLAKQMQVQGAVILEALIGKNGNIQNLRVLSGPAILSDAARDAVKQWHFKPYLMAGQPVETQARITVNFTISTD
ncbi:MAG: energy transducer TonB [Terriglobales bacterium]|jgi:TonB family protein